MAILGLGLIGGSLALALRRFRPELRRVGADPDPRARELARERAAVQEVFDRPEAAVAGCDLVVLAAPVDVNLALLEQIAPRLGPQTLVTDTGSTKATIAARGHELLGGRFVGGHPLSGAERGGLEAADPFLFENALVALTPDEPATPAARALSGLWEDLGAQVLILEPERHDVLVAWLSHLPQLVATALCDLVAERAQTDALYRELAAGGFRDLTRVAASPYALWEPILRDNLERVDAALETLQRHLDAFRAELRRGGLAARFARAGAFRRALPQRAKGLWGPLHRIALVLQDRPGALVEALSVLAREGINLKDLELNRLREGDGSTFTLYVATPQDAALGAAALRAGGWEAWTAS